MKRHFNPQRRPMHRRVQKSLPQYQLLEAIRAVEVISKHKNPIIEQPILSGNFEQFQLSSQLLQNILHKNYVVPTPIQQKAIQPILEGQDVLGIANTGTGKTAAFLIPLIQKVTLNKMELVLIIAPTRELALQIQEELKELSKGLGITSALLIGGMSMNRQKADLRNHPHFIIGTPGRIKDLIREKSLTLSRYANVVLDEADRMVDIGFIGDIKYFISLLPSQRQSLFFSATIDGKVKDILHAFVKNPVTVKIEEQSTPEGIAQDIIKVENGYTKIETLHNLLAQGGFQKVLIFGRTKWGVQKLANELQKRGFRAAAIHGNKNQNQRQRALEQFKSNEIQVLLATDVASRGIDIPDVTHVINYDMPATMEDYIHRIGRTGRAEKKGIALTFVE